METVIFVTAAIAIHMAVFATTSQSGSVSGGIGGTDKISIAPATRAVVEMVEHWQRPPDAQTDVRTEVTTPNALPTDAPVMPQLEITEAPRARMRVAVLQPDEQDEARINTTPPPPRPPKPKPLPEAEPAAKPKPKSQPATPTDAKNADTNSEHARQRQAAGAAGSVQAGGGTAKAAASSSRQNTRAQASWAARIRARIERNLRTPRGLDKSGKVIVEFNVARDGKLLNYRIARSSGDAVLDKIAMDAFARTGRFPKAPKKLTGDSFNFSLPVAIR